MNWLSILKTVVTVVLPMIHPKLNAVAPLILQGITEAEQLKGASGQEKLQHVVDLVNTTVAGVNAATGKQIIDPVAVNATAASAISTAVDVTNLIHSAQADPTQAHQNFPVK